MFNPPPPPQVVNGAPYVTKLYASSGIDMSKCIESASMKFTTLVDYIYICVQSRMRVIHVFFLNVFKFYLFFFDSVKARPIRYCIELPV